MPTKTERPRRTDSIEAAAEIRDKAEASVIGCCLLLESAIDDAMEILKPEHFYDPTIASVFRVMSEMRTSGKRKVDVLTLLDELEKKNLLAGIGGAERLMEFSATVPHSAFVKDYVATVLDFARRRGAEVAARTLLISIPDRSVDTDDLLAAAESAIHRAMETGMTDEPQSIGEILHEAVAEIGSDKRKPRAVTTDWTELDEKSNGLPLGGVVILAARPSAGKTACALSLAAKMAEAGVEILFTSYEQTRVELAQRLLSIFSGLDHYKLSKSRLTDEERDRLMVAAGTLHKLPISLDDSCRPQASLLTMIRRQVRRHKTKLVIVDYLQLVEPDDRKQPREQQVANISRQLKRVAMACNVAVLCLSQLNRDVEKRDSKRPKLSDLRESGSIEQDADQVWLLHRPNSDRTEDEQRSDHKLADDHAILEIAKNRNGPRGELRIDWYPGCMKYSKEYIPPFN